MSMIKKEYNSYLNEASLHVWVLEGDIWWILPLVFFLPEVNHHKQHSKNQRLKN